MSRRFTCPFCFQTCRMNEVLYVCPSCGQPSRPGFLEREPIKCKIPGCSGHIALRQCPACGSKIPKILLEATNLPLIIVGTSGSGKTVYTTVMLKELKRHIELGLVLHPATRETNAEQNINEWSIYYRHTVPAATMHGVPGPQIWHIRNAKRRHRYIVPSYSLTIYNGSSEAYEFMPASTTSPVCCNISASEAVILVIDPLTLSAVHQGGVVDWEVMWNSLGGDMGTSKNSEDVINSVAEYIKMGRGIKAVKRLDIPVAVVFTKLDTILKHEAFGPQAIIRKNSLPIRDGQVDLAELRQVDSEMRVWLKQIGEDRIITALDANFTDYHLFGVSSFGAPPKDSYTLEDEIKPLRVLDPILWLFKKKGIIN